MRRIGNGRSNQPAKRSGIVEPILARADWTRWVAGWLLGHPSGLFTDVMSRTERAKWDATGARREPLFWRFTGLSRDLGFLPGSHPQRLIPRDLETESTEPCSPASPFLG